jgi:hypothetical protein
MARSDFDRRLEKAQELARRSPAERLVEEVLLPPEPLGEPLTDAPPVFRPWEPKGATAVGVPPAKTVVGVNLRFSDPPPQTAGGAPPSHHRPLGQFGLDDGSV